MELDLYFKPLEAFEYGKGTLGFQSTIYINDFPDWEIADIVIISVNESRGNKSHVYGDLEHQKIRNYFYKFHFPTDLKIVDLGVLQHGAELSDTYLALKEITNAIQKKGKFLIILGGTQDLTYANYLGYENLEQTVNLTCIDNKFDFCTYKEGEIDNENYINHLLLHRPSYLFNFSILGIQQYYIQEDQSKLFDDLYFDCLRLGELQKNIENAEPFLRNTDILSIDLGSIRAGEFKGGIHSGPNGFFGNEICQLMKYAGISDKLSSVGIYNQTFGALENIDCELVAQMMYFLVFGFSQRKNDFPIGSKKDHVKYSVFHEDLKHNLVFHKSPKSERWWLEVPYPPAKDFKFERHHLVPCNHNDYQIAQKGVIPDLWWKTYRKLN